MIHDMPAYGLWPLVIINSAVFFIFALSFTNPVWFSFGAFSGFIVTLFAERNKRYWLSLVNSIEIMQPKLLSLYSRIQTQSSLAEANEKGPLNLEKLCQLNDKSRYAASFVVGNLVTGIQGHGIGNGIAKAGYEEAIGTCS